MECIAKVIDLTGQRFGRWAVIKRVSNNKTGAAMWDCVCDCGVTAVVRGAHLNSGSSTSCGCYAKDVHTKHGKCGSPEYRAYYNMIKRCEYENDNRYADYGGRGIKVCPKWRSSFEQFLADMGPRPSDRHSIDRIDVNGDYEAGNCRWAVSIIQERNKRTRKDSPVGSRGIRRNEKKDKYVAQIYVAGKTKRIGTFCTYQEALQARKEAENKYWGE